MKVALLGAGWFGREAHLRNLIRMEGIEVAAVSSRSEESLSAARELAGPSLHCTRNWKELVGSHEIDAVIVSLTNDQHYVATIAALEAGKHVLCEKPLGLSLRQCDEINECAATSGKVLQVGHEMRFQALYEEMKARIERGDVGALQLMWCREFRGPMRPGWRSKESLTGGTILEKNVHHIDLFHWMIPGKAVRVSAHGGTNVLSDREVLDNAQVLIEFEEGRRATLELCLFAPSGGECEIGVCGDEGRIDTRNQALELTYHSFNEGTSETKVVEDDDTAANFTDGSGRVDRGIGPELEHFFECIRTGKKPLNDGESAREAVAVCLAAQESIRRKESVTMAEFEKG